LKRTTPPTLLGDPSTNPRGPEPRWWRLVVPFVIVSIGVLLSLGAWTALGSRERETLHARLVSAGSELSRSFESTLTQEFAQLQDLAESWGRLGTDDAARWHADANRFRQAHPGCLALEWLPSTQPSATLASGTPEALNLLASRPMDPASQESRRAAEAGGFSAYFGPWTGPDGRSILEVQVPVPVADRDAMVLTALVDPGVTIDRVVAPWLEDYGIEVAIGQESVYRRGDPPADELYRLSDRRDLRPGFQGPDWSLTVQPGPGLIASPRLPMRHVVLVGSLVLTVLITLTYWVGQVAFQRARELHDATFELNEQRRALLRVRRDRQALAESMLSMKSEMESRSSDGAPDPATSELETFTYSISHDLRSPMGAILNYAGVLNEDYHSALGPEGRDHLRRITASAQRAIAMMDGLLSFSRVGSRELKIADIDVASMVREIHGQLSDSLRDSERAPTLSMGEIPHVRADRTLISTMFTNLLSNAFKFTRGVEDPRVEVGGYVQDEEVVYYVKDNGVGFDMRYANKLFHVFERLPTKEHHDGHGLGLAVVERIVRRHGGSIRAEAVPDKGATFFVTLPTEPLQASSIRPEVARFP
jgi:signal transduction histidine kinase